MALETGTYISDLVSTNPVSSDNISQGDDHIRLLKSTIKATFPNITGAVTPTHTDLNKLTSSGSPQFSTIELGHASDTTITRSAAGVIAVEGKPVVMTTGGQTIEHALGAVGTPSITATGDTNTGFWFPAADTIAASTGGSERVRIDSSGNVLVGTSTSVSGKLQVLSSVDGNTLSAAFKNISNLSANTAVSVDLVSDQSTSRLTSYRDGAGNGSSLAISTSNGGTLSERMRIDSSGNVGINKSSPAYKLDVDSGAVGGIAARFNGSIVWSGSSSTNVYINGSATTDTLLFGTQNNERMRITSAGEVYIAGTTDQGAYNLQCNGTGVWGAGAYVNGSDARIKDDIAPIGSCLDIVASLNPVTFKYKEDWSKDQSVQPGFIAQELQASLGNTNYVDGVVVQGPEYMSVAYQSLIPVLTKALQEALTKIDALEARIASLEAA